ncbi:MAG: hypothetical protein IIV27_09240 [Clostridia bacterium]|nr:hypothetical protein [Clostridia bacterium]MBQ5685809.1 hypothetical protein [Clostridia bacterium]
MENYFEKELYIDPSLADADGLLSRYETFNIFMNVADAHAGSMEVAWRDISPRDLFWLTVKTKIVFEERPKLGDTVTLATWVEPPTRLRGDRSYEMRQGDRVLVRGRTEWAVLNTKTMKLVPIDDVYPEGLDYSRPSACPEGFTRIRDRFDASDRYAEYTVRSTDIDVGHHMNNAKYVQALLGTFSNEELREMRPKSFDVLFRNSVYEGDVLAFYKQPAETGFDIRVARESDDMTALLVHME